MKTEGNENGRAAKFLGVPIKMAGSFAGLVLWYALDSYFDKIMPSWILLFICVVAGVILQEIDAAFKRSKNALNETEKSNELIIRRKPTNTDHTPEI